MGLPDVPPDSDFALPDWSAPLDVDAAIAEMPASATISGMFLSAVVMEAKRHGFALPSARERYVQFNFYPVREHARLLMEACHRIYPHRTLRDGLRKLGRGAPQALVASTLGKVVLGSAEGVHQIIAAMAKAYPLNARPASVTVLESLPRRAIVRLEDIHYFVDSHHVGTFEGVLKYAGTKGRVLVAKRGVSAADLLLEWED